MSGGRDLGDYNCRLLACSCGVIGVSGVEGRGAGGRGVRGGRGEASRGKLSPPR